MTRRVDGECLLFAAKRYRTPRMFPHVDLSDIPPGTDIPRVVNVIVEIPKGRRNNSNSTRRPASFASTAICSHRRTTQAITASSRRRSPRTATRSTRMVMVNEPTFSGCLIETRVLGLFRMVDRGKNDYKVFGVPHTDPLMAELQTLADVPHHFLREVEHFFATYKQSKEPRRDARLVARGGCDCGSERIGRPLPGQGRPGRGQTGIVAQPVNRPVMDERREVQRGDQVFDHRRQPAGVMWQQSLKFALPPG